MPLPTGPNAPGGLPQRPNGGLPVPNQRPTTPQTPQQPSQKNPSAAELSGMDRLSEYDFGGKETDRSALKREGDSLEHELTAEDLELKRQAEERRDRDHAARFEKAMEEKPTQEHPKNNVLSPQRGELDEKGQNVFIDKKSKKVEPFGGKKTTIKVNDLDRRRNMRQNATIVQFVVIILLVVTLGFAVKNAFFPPLGLTESDVEGIVYTATGTTSFPLEQGGYFAESFMQAYLEYNENDPASAEVLGYYTRGALVDNGVPDGTSYAKNFRQTVVNGPIVYRSQAASANSAIYTVGALVRVEDALETSATPSTGATAIPQDEGADTVSTPSSGSSASSATPATGNLVWKYFTINVYYDDATNSFAIASIPTVVATPDVQKTSSVPGAAPYGTGKSASSDAIDAVTPTIFGFLSAYRESSSSDYAQLLPFLPDDPDSSLLTGLDGVYEFRGGKADANSVDIAVYETGTTALKAILTVTWVQNVGDSYVEVQSQYVMDILPITGGYDVVRFLPLAYVPGS